VRILASGTRSIIVAAGQESQMGSYTDNKPKCMLEFGGKDSRAIKQK
tara:strand:+ start:867 stop:1007 length:141 start_codon:yes stop_codon:yes gene_type:complete